MTDNIFVDCQDPREVWTNSVAQDIPHEDTEITIYCQG